MVALNTTAYLSERILAPHQELMVARSHELHGCLGYWCEPRTGKTRAALTYLREAGFQRVIVVAPLTAAGVWRAEARTIGFHLPTFVAAGGSQVARTAALKSWLALHPSSLLILNYQPYGVGRKPPKDAEKGVQSRWAGGRDLASVLMEWQPDAIIADEAQALRGRTSQQSKFLWQLGRLPSVRCRIALSGTPIANSPQDLFGIYRFIDPSVFGTRWQAIDGTGFADQFLTFGYWGQVNGSKNEEELKRRIEATSIQVARSAAWGGLPQRMDNIYPVVLSEESSARYRQFSRDMVADIEGYAVDGSRVKGVLSADLVITKAMRLQQLVGGHTKIDGAIVDVSSEKIDAALDLTRQAVDGGEQVVLFCAFRREIARLAAALSTEYPRKVGVLQGGSDAEIRTTMIEAFHRGTLRVLVCQNQVASKSIDLAAANVGIVVSTGYSLDDFEQLRERLTGIDPQRRFFYYYLQAELAPNGKPTIDAKIYRVLEAKQRLAGRFLQLDYARRLLGAED